MAALDALARCLNPIILNLKKMELELKCPTCLKLLDQPIMLPCSHIFCSDCITDLTKSLYECPSCKLPFVSQDLKLSAHINSLINIYKSMNTAVAATFPCQGSQDDSFIKRMTTNESPASGTNYLKETSEMPKFAARGKSSNPQFPASNVRVQDDCNELDTQRSQKCMHNLGQEAFSDKGEQCSPLSFASVKDTDSDDSGQERNLGTKRSPLIVKDEHREGADIGTSKRQKLKSESDTGGKGGMSTADPALTSDHEYRSSPDTHTLDASRNLSASRVVACVFCQSNRMTEASGKMIHILNGKEIDADQAFQPDVFHVHEKCIEWAPQIYYSGNTIMGLEKELSRASKIKCSSCGLKGAALGCYVKSCKRSYHVPCAYDIEECRWDCVNFLVLCPAHTSHKLPCDKSKSRSYSKADNPSRSSSPVATVSHGHPVQSVAIDFVLCGSALSKEEKAVVDEFACLSRAEVSNYWGPNITHVIASVDEQGGCSRTLKVLMAILTGKWILNIDWVKASIAAGHPVEEKPYEVTHDVHGVFDGPKLGRIRAMQKAPKLLNGSCFYVIDNFEEPCFKKYIEDLISTGGGTFLKKSDLVQFEMSGGKELPSRVFVIYSAEPPSRADLVVLDEALKRSSDEAEALAVKVGGQAIPHTKLLDYIAACKF